ncbi:MAG: hypothetical protein NDI61_02535 [Bdellovibrionaceae bacterium]|nr:hypothetical protein [Pseudobdellovibrionaceae bacterium]
MEKRAAAVYAALLSRPPRGLPSATVLVATSSKKGPWLASLYERNLVEASAQTERLSDKLIMFRVLEQAIGFKAAQYYPRTLGLKEFLEKHRLVDNQGRLQADGERIEQALFAEFPAGFVVRPAVGVAPMETRKGLYPEGDEFIAALVAGKFPGYEPKHFRRPVSSHILDDVASGEAVVLQDDVILRAESRKKLKSRTYREVRVHTYENKVVADSIPTRWVQETNVDEESARRVEVFVGEFLDALPSRMLSRQAWGVDVAVFDNGELLITDIVTNRGRKIQWSSYLEQPRIIGAYARHFEREAGLRFEGVAGLLMRNNFGNYFPYWDTRIEKSRPGLNKLLSYLPPLP